MQSIFKYAEDHLQVFVFGFLDAISYWKAIPILYGGSVELREKVLLVVGANMFLLVGSAIFYPYCMSPILRYMTGQDQSEIIRFIYETSWVLPMLMLCYAVSFASYQEIANIVFRQLRSKQPSLSPTVGQVAQTGYALGVWLIVFFQVQILTNMVPLFCQLMNFLVDWIMGKLLGTSAEFLTSATAAYFYILSTSVHSIGLFLMAAMYGWYSFDPFW